MDIPQTSIGRRRWFLILNALALAVGNCAGPLLTRIYFLHGGKRIWFSSWLQTAGWPIVLVPLLVSYTRRRRQYPEARVVQLEPGVFAAAAAIGALTGLANYLYSASFARLPVSTSSLILASQLAFTAGFAYLLVKQRFTAYSVNAVVLLTVGAAVLGLHTNRDRPEEETKKEYFVGFGMMVATAVVFGCVLPLIELTYSKIGKRVMTYSMVLEVELVMGLVATAFCTVGMFVNNDFQAIGREAKAYGLGETKYYMVVVWSAILFQGFFLGSAGIIYYSSSLLSGVIITLVLPVTETLAVVLFHEKFHVEKGVSLFLALWGFLSYFYGEMVSNTDELDDLNRTPNRDDVVRFALPNKDGRFEISIP